MVGIVASIVHTTTIIKCFNCKQCHSNNSVSGPIKTKQQKRRKKLEWFEFLCWYLRHFVFDTQTDAQADVELKSFYLWRESMRERNIFYLKRKFVFIFYLSNIRNFAKMLLKLLITWLLKIVYKRICAEIHMVSKKLMFMCVKSTF